MRFGYKIYKYAIKEAADLGVGVAEVWVLFYTNKLTSMSFLTRLNFLNILNQSCQIIHQTRLCSSRTFTQIFCNQQKPFLITTLLLGTCLVTVNISISVRVEWMNKSYSAVCDGENTNEHSIWQHGAAAQIHIHHSQIKAFKWRLLWYIACCYTTVNTTV